MGASQRQGVSLGSTVEIPFCERRIRRWELSELGLEEGALGFRIRGKPCNVKLPLLAGREAAEEWAKTTHTH